MCEINVRDMYETNDNNTVRKFYVFSALFFSIEMNWRIFLKQQLRIKLGPHVALSNCTWVSVLS
jgi:hypothetical protein